MNATTPPQPNDAPAALPADVNPPPRRFRRWAWGALLVVSFAGLMLAWRTDDRVRRVESELARRQQDTQSLSSEAHMMSKQAQEVSREMAAKVTLLEGRLAEAALQRSQIEELILSLSRSRDENLLADIDTGLRVAQQQAALTGSAEPLMVALKQSDERLARHSQPRLDAVRRALARDLDRVKAVSITDLSSLSIKLDEAVRLVDELPLLAQASPQKGTATAKLDAAAHLPPSKASVPSALWASLAEHWDRGLGAVWSEVRSLVRVTRIDHPDAALLAPDQAFFVRENLKLRLLNARLALLSRQFETTQSDLQLAQTLLDRYFDRSSRRTVVALDLVKQVLTSGRSPNLPRPDETLAALSIAAAGR